MAWRAAFVGFVAAAASFVVLCLSCERLGQQSLLRTLLRVAIVAMRSFLRESSVFLVLNRDLFLRSLLRALYKLLVTFDSARLQN